MLRRRAGRVSGAGFGLHAASWPEATIGLVNVLSTVIAIAFVDRWGASRCRLRVFAIMAVSMAIVGTLLGAGVHSETMRILVAGMLLVFIVGFAMGAGPLVWILCAEIQPLKGRDFGIVCSTFTNCGWEEYVSDVSVGGHSRTSW